MAIYEASGMADSDLGLSHESCSEAPVVELAGVTKRYPGGERPAVESVSLRLAPGELLGAVGPSGCGKTTLLRLIAGFERPTAGQVLVSGTIVAGPSQWVRPERRRIGMVFQSYALFPHLTVARNISFGLARKDIERTARVQELLDLVGLSGLGSRYPHELSGGQQQRVALARALAPRPSVILLDEPFNSLDSAVRRQVRQDVREILRAQGASAVFVTHDSAEALTLADRVAVMRAGRLEQVDTPVELYHAPRTRFVAEFLGMADFLPAEATGEGLRTDAGLLPNPVPRHSGPAEVLLRPEEVELVPHTEGNAVIIGREFRGPAVVYALQMPCGVVIRSERQSADLLPVGVRVSTRVRPSHLVLFDGERTVASRCLAERCGCSIGQEAGEGGQTH